MKNYTVNNNTGELNMYGTCSSVVELAHPDFVTIIFFVVLLAINAFLINKA